MRLRAMIHYNVWFSFRSNVEETEGLAVIHAFLGELHLAGDVAGFQLLKNSGDAAKTKMLPFQALIEFRDEVQFSAAFSAQAARGIHTGLQGALFRWLEISESKSSNNSSSPAPYPPRNRPPTMPAKCKSPNQALRTAPGVERLHTLFFK